MKNQLNLKVNKPCLENFNQFAPTENGGFCNSCTKEVIDFTAMKDAQIVNYFKTNSDENTCGRFRSHQLKTYEDSNKIETRFSFASRIGIACLALFSFGVIQGQNTKTGKVKVTNTIQNEGIVVKGNVSEGTIPLPGVNVILKGSKIGTQTDFDGNFTFPQKLKKGDVLLFSYVGMESQKVVINDGKSASKIALKVNMELDEIIIMGDVASKRVFKSRRN